MNDYIFLIVGPSGSGKTTVVNKLIHEFPGTLRQVQSYTTRPKRYSDETGHVFVTDKEFDALTDIVAYTKFAGFRYAATASQITQSGLYVIDPYGITMLKEQYHGNKSIRVIGIWTDEKEREQRMLKRGDSPINTMIRLEHDRKIFQMDICDVVFMNRDLDETYRNVATYIYEKLYKTWR